MTPRTGDGLWLDDPNSAAAPWARLAELVHVIDQPWCVIGGTMVAIHAAVAGVPPTRATDDVGLLVHITAGGSIAGVAAALAKVGYVAQESLDAAAAAHRWVRPSSSAGLPGQEKVDVLTEDHLKRPPRFGRRPTVAADGATAVLKRHMTSVAFRDGDTDAEVVVPIRTPVGGLILKGGAYAIASRAPERHLEDALTLFAAVADAQATLTKNERRRVARLVRGLDDEGLWDRLGPAWQQKGRVVADALITVPTGLSLLPPPRR